MTRKKKPEVWIDEIRLTDPGQDGPVWTWTGPGFSPEVAEHERRRYARRQLKLQREFCLSGDVAHAFTARTWSQLNHTYAPPWAEAVLARLAWSAMMEGRIVRRRKNRQVDWIRYAAVDDHLRQQLAAGVKQPNEALAYREVSNALRGQPGRGAWSRIKVSYLKVRDAIRRDEVDKFALGVLDNRFPTDVLGHERQRMQAATEKALADVNAKFPVLTDKNSAKANAFCTERIRFHLSQSTNSKHVKTGK